MALTRITLPERVRAGESVEVQWLIAHPMETGYRADDLGQVVPRDILRSFECLYLGERVVRLSLYPAIAANPYGSFTLKADRSGPVVFRWEGDHGFVQQEERRLEVI
jgi:sulfur-oxidizing protein SoxZ